jgi:phenylacetate-CoA ligase
MQPRYYNPAVECMSREQLAELQLRKLRRFLRFAYVRSPFYRRKFDAAGLDVDDIRTLEDFKQRVPLTTKREWLDDQAEHPPCGSAPTVAPDEIVRYYLTSGTSGIGQEVHAMSRADLEAGASLTYGFHWAGIEPGDSYVNTLPVGLGNLTGPDTGIHAALRKRLNVFNLGHMNASQKLATMRRFPPRFIWAVPAYLQRLEILMREEGIDPRKEFELKSILIAAEPYSIDWAARREEFWGCPLTELYGSTQAGGVAAFACELGAVHGDRRGVMHFLEHLVVGEVVDRDTREDVAAGEEGELVLTSLERVATPVIRWATDDRVRFASAADCACGRPFDGIYAGEVARFDDMMKIKGVNVWPSAVDGIMFRTAEVAEYQAEVVETAKGSDVVIEVEVAEHVGPDDATALLERLGRELREQVGVGMTLRPAAQPLPRFEFKVRRWTDHRLRDRERILHVERPQERV